MATTTASSRAQVNGDVIRVLVIDDDRFHAETVAETIRATVRQFGIRGCAGLMAQEFGDHPEAAAERMRWVRQLLTGAPAPSQTKCLRLRLGGVTPGGGVTRAISGRQAGHGGPFGGV